MNKVNIFIKMPNYIILNEDTVQKTKSKLHFHEYENISYKKFAILIDSLIDMNSTV